MFYSKEEQEALCGRTFTLDHYAHYNPARGIAKSSMVIDHIGADGTVRMFGLCKRKHVSFDVVLLEPGNLDDIMLAMVQYLPDLTDGYI